MIKKMRHQKGLSLVEAMLAFVIAGAIMRMGILLYESYKRDSDALNVQTNVDMLANAAGQYYYAECYGRTNPSTGAVVYGALNAANPSTITSPLKLNITTDLINRNYMASTLRPSAFVNSSASNTTNGYIVQLERSNSSRTVCTNASCSTSNTIGTSVSWKIVIGVAATTVSTMDRYTGTMQATCKSRLSGTTVISCSTAPASGTNSFWIFERMPSFTNSQGASDFWLANPVLNEFTMPFRNRTNLPAAAGATQYFLCGS